MTAGLFCRILVGWDGSADAAEALRAAVAIAGPGGHVVALSVIPQQVRMEPHDEPDSVPELLQRTAETVFGQLRGQDIGAAGVQTSTRMITGDSGRAGHMLSAYAAVHQFDLVVMGRRGESIRPAHLGRSAKAVAQTAHHSYHHNRTEPAPPAQTNPIRTARRCNGRAPGPANVISPAHHHGPNAHSPLATDSGHHPGPQSLLPITFTPGTSHCSEQPGPVHPGGGRADPLGGTDCRCPAFLG